ncbi:Nucleoside triphosphate pyrophosphohydrolase MazG [hydrothermal vent metagenome]|uniref:Nucleoside triphosphate pyrophosphohydrolase MazG n=1 Tax=hydrothermal vent metagenome TaxID=652676 RepID=A0A3B0RU93_9ZZZZ
MTKNTIEDLLTIMERLRNPDGGCPWDIEQDFSTIAPYTIEEAYEVAEAIEMGDMLHLKDELGDLLFQVVFHTQMAQEKGHFTFDDVVTAICDKMTRRHPHVFGDAAYRDAEQQTVAWEAQKAEERKDKNQTASVLDGVTPALPALTRAIKLQNRAARVGFDWPDTVQVLDKLNEEMAELSHELVEAGKGSDNADKITEEFGDMMFVYANLARHLDIDAETALRSANHKFERRFRQVEQMANAQGKSLDEMSLDQMDTLWDRVKEQEKKNSAPHHQNI